MFFRCQRRNENVVLVNVAAHVTEVTTDGSAVDANVSIHYDTGCGRNQSTNQM